MSPQISPKKKYLDNYEYEKCKLVKERFASNWKKTFALFWKINSGVVNSNCHFSINVITVVSCWYALKTVDTNPLTSTQKHIILCVIGYQLLMAEAILAFNRSNGWAQALTVSNKKLAHWLLQVAGCSLAIAGSVLKTVNKPVNFTSTHGIIGFVAMLLTCVSLLNGISALFAYELRHFTKRKFLKLAHIISGTLAYVLASVSLCYGFDKAKFRAWATPGATTVVMAFNTFVVSIHLWFQYISGYFKPVNQWFEEVVFLS